LVGLPGRGITRPNWVLYTNNGTTWHVSAIYSGASNYMNLLKRKWIIKNISIHNAVA
jgi:hypothetical protein